MAVRSGQEVEKVDLLTNAAVREDGYALNAADKSAEGDPKLPKRSSSPGIRSRMQARVNRAVPATPDFPSRALR